MRHRLISVAASALSAVNLWAVEPPTYLPGGPAKPAADAPVLLPTNPAPAKADDCESCLTGGSTGLRPGIDRLPCPECVRPLPKFYGGLEYVLTWFDDRRPPALIGTATASGVGPLNVLYGGNRTDFGVFDGLRATAGYWLDNRQTAGVEVSAFLTERQLVGTTATHDGTANQPLALGRVVPSPTDPILGPLVGLPNVLSGTIAAAESSRLWGTEANFVANAGNSDTLKLDLLAGARYLDLDEKLDVFSQSFDVMAQLPLVGTAEGYGARTQFYGGQLGARASACWGRVTASAAGKLGVGVSHQAVDRGLLQTGGPAVLLLPLPPGANVRDTTDKFAVVPEALLKVGVRVTERLDVSVGYNVLYLTSAARAADQVSDGFAPKVGISSTDFVAQGVSFGVGFRY